jgi:V/A-type H+-transporting ATPase subunit D
MSKIKHTKNEFKKQKDNLKRFQHYLPALQLKKQQLQLEIIKLLKKIEDIENEIRLFKSDIDNWVNVFGEDIDLRKIVSVSAVNVRVGNIAGVDIPVLEKLEFTEKEYSFYDTPLWVDFGIEAVKKMATLVMSQKIIHKQIEAIREELRVINQRVNLFEKVKIPEARNNIRKIQIFLGDMQTSAVVIGKIAKDKIAEKKEAVAV